MVKQLKQIARNLLGNLKDNYAIRLCPTSTEIVIAADASYGEHEDGKSQSAACIGLRSFRNGIDGASYFIFGSLKQTIVAKSSREGELIAANYGVDYGILLQQLLEEMGYGHNVMILLQDNTSTIGSINRTWIT